MYFSCLLVVVPCVIKVHVLVFKFKKNLRLARTYVLKEHCLFTKIQLNHRKRLNHFCVLYKLISAFYKLIID